MACYNSTYLVLGWKSALIFLDGHPSKHSTSSKPLNFNDEKETGSFKIIWPLANLKNVTICKPIDFNILTLDCNGYHTHNQNSQNKGFHEVYLDCKCTWIVLQSSNNWCWLHRDLRNRDHSRLICLLILALPGHFWRILDLGGSALSLLEYDLFLNNLQCFLSMEHI